MRLHSRSRFAAALMLVAGAVSAEDETLDSGWGVDGLAVAAGEAAAFPSGQQRVDLLRLSTGRYLALAARSGNQGHVSTRRLANGDPDPSYGGGDGIATATLPGGLLGSHHAAVRRGDGQIAVVGGFSNAQADVFSGVCLLTVAGTTYNGAFGVSGCRTFDIETLGVTESEAFSAVIDLGANALFAVGETYADEILDQIHTLTAVRLAADGSVAADFNGGAVRRHDFGFPVDNVRAAAAGAEQVVAAFTSVGDDEPHHYLRLVRLNIADGSLDPTFGTAGVAVVPYATGAPGYQRFVPRDLAVLADGRIVVALQIVSPNAGIDEVGVFRLLPDGVPDPSFGDAGRLHFRFDELNPVHRVHRLAVDDLGRVLVSVTIAADNALTGGELGLARVRADGTLDEAFNASGRFRLQLDRDPAPAARNADVAGALLRADGRILLAGISDGPGTEFEPVVLGFATALHRDGFEEPVLPP